MGRSYRQADIKLLFGLSACMCAFPGCDTVCSEPETAKDDKLIYAEICHICAVKDDGPRSEWLLTPSERNRYPNLILLCPTHHRIVDAQSNTYDATTLRKWKRDCENLVKTRLAENMLNVTFNELYSASSMLLGPNGSGKAVPGTGNLTLTPIEMKIHKNGLTTSSRSTITMSMAAASAAQGFLEKMTITDPNFPEQLRTCFVQEYNELVKAGLTGDSLFVGMLDFATNRLNAFGDKSAAIALLVHFFESCDVFQP